MSRLHLARIVPPVIAPLFLVLQVLAASVLPDAGDATLAQPPINDCILTKPREIDMAKGEQKGNREAKKPKKEKIKTIAAAPSQKTAGWQPSFASGKKK